MNKKISLINNAINETILQKVAEWLLTNPQLTKGNLTLQLESEFSSWLGVKHSTFVNSGSSAILLMLATLIESGQLKKYSKIVVPALSWATDLAPVIQLGLHPILCDCNLTDLSVDIDELENIFKCHSPEALLLVSVLGLVPKMETIAKLCTKYGVILLEDACESMGSSFGNQKLGTFGDMSCFSLYYGHHISTIEGGFVCTNNDNYNNLLKMCRSHGWDRDLNTETQTHLRTQHKISDFHAPFTFYIPGYNVRSTDLQAFIGLEQMKLIDSIVKIRQQNFNLYAKNIINNELTFDITNQNTISNFAFPVVSNNRVDIIDKLIESQIETRPLLCGSMGIQPMYVKRFGKKSMSNADKITNYGFYLPNHPGLTEENIKYIVNTINKVNPK